MSVCQRLSPALNGVQLRCSLESGHAGLHECFDGGASYGRVTWEFNSDNVARLASLEVPITIESDVAAASADPGWLNVRRSCGHVELKAGSPESLRGLWEKSECTACVQTRVLRGDAPAPITLTELLSRLDALVALARHGRFELFAIVLEREGQLVRDHPPAFEPVIADTYKDFMKWEL